ncbi:MAG: hypothetical protein M3P49_16525 [Actinomycetota bacterium]|nr:hypothetical protein [Actinomycetota bacterium]
MNYVPPVYNTFPGADLSFDRARVRRSTRRLHRDRHVEALRRVEADGLVITELGQSTHLLALPVMDLELNRNARLRDEEGLVIWHRSTQQAYLEMMLDTAPPPEHSHVSDLGSSGVAAQVKPHVPRVSVLRRGGLISIGIIFVSIALLLITVPFGLAGMYLGAAIFCFANFAAHERREPAYILGPAIAGYGTLAALLLAIIMVVAGIDQM